MGLSQFKQRLADLWSLGRGPYLLLGLLFFSIFIAPPLIYDGYFPWLIIEIAFMLILISGVFALPFCRRTRFATILFASVALLARGLHQFNPHDLYMNVLDNVLTSLALGLFALLLIKRFLLDKTALEYRIASAVAVYLLFGVLWARLYELIHVLKPGSFHLGANVNDFSLLYFSFVTLVTLGYGDIVPISQVARSLTMLEGLVGQLYIVILISSLVSEFSASAAKAAQNEISKKG